MLETGIASALFSSCKTVQFFGDSSLGCAPISPTVPFLPSQNRLEKDEQYGVEIRTSEQTRILEDEEKYQQKHKKLGLMWIDLDENRLVQGIPDTLFLEAPWGTLLCAVLRAS